ncbi:hypothetical protein, partial [Blautia sp. C3-R-101]|uniref:hypothetical protein n=1 Tax=Blautia sp. C3-R-101 TaxID=2949654 RepID=UPI00202FE7B8
GKCQLMQGIFQKENTDKALKYGIYRHLPTYEKIIRNLVSFFLKEGDVVEYFDNAAKALGIIFMKFEDKETAKNVLVRINDMYKVILD